jgi:hypothetical protein
MFTQLVSGTRFSAHLEMCELVEALEDSVVDFSFRGRDNYFLMETPDGVRYINYVFLVNQENLGWTMKLLNEAEFIPNINAPIRLIRQSTCEIESAVQWRKLVRKVNENYEMEKLSISNETTPTCLCRSKIKPVRVQSEVSPAVSGIIDKLASKTVEKMPF